MTSLLSFASLEASEPNQGETPQQEQPTTETEAPGRAARSSAASVRRFSTPDLERADRIFRLAEFHEPGDAKNQFYLEAETLAEKALKDSPDDADAHFLYFAARGRRLLAGGPHKSMFALSGLQEHLAKAIELDPNHGHALASQGGLLFDLPRFLGGDVEKAKSFLLRAAEVNSKGPGTRLSLARVYLKEGDEDAARRELNLAAHYARLTWRASTLKKAVEMLADLD